MERSSGARIVHQTCTRRGSQSALKMKQVPLFAGLESIKLAYQAERGGFEPPMGFDPHNGLANRRFRPLSHLSLTATRFTEPIRGPQPTFETYQTYESSVNSKFFRQADSVNLSVVQSRRIGVDPLRLGGRVLGRRSSAVDARLPIDQGLTKFHAGKGRPDLSESGAMDSKSKRKRRRRRFATGLGILLLLILYIFRLQIFYGNFDVVDRDHVFRSSQPEGRLKTLIREHHIATVLNLRGGSFSDSFYAEEVRVTREQGVDFYDHFLSADRRPTRRELLVLLDLFDRCRYPLLIHCKSGSDRTALASGFYLMAKRGESPQQALRAFSLRYGHFAMGGTEHLHEPFLEYAAWLDRQHLANSPERLREWVEHDYVSQGASSTFQPLRPGPRETLTGRSAGSRKASAVR